MILINLFIMSEAWTVLSIWTGVNEGELRV